ncbi:msx2-interacting protein-like [Homalodisca vitripennis]|uniref:msx2-interacting protein-like n=1 Tax=Homalodisca vitripennis TaxID=197043 RepID=UPI001EEB177E|nr:msx2-interacting protein-like [Homalodisca vitripennis]
MVPEVPDGGGRAPPAAVAPGAEAVEALPVFAAAVPVPPPGPLVFPAPQALPVVPPIQHFLMVVDGAALQAPVLPPVPVVGQQLVINHCLVCLEHKEVIMVAVPCEHPTVCEDCAPQLEREHRFCIA